MTGPVQPSIIYLDVDDEITSAAARIRATGTERIALVLPSGSRLATSRINFRLLAREAQARTRSLAIVAPEPGTRSLAASAGLPVYATVTEYENAAETGAVTTATAAGATSAGGTGIRGGGSPREAGADGPGLARGLTRLEETQRWDGGTIATRPRPRPEADAWPEPEERPSGGRRWLAILIAVLLLFAVVGGVGAYVVLPTAIVTVRAVPEPVGPLTLEITADPLAANVDPAKLVVPAELVTFDLEAGDEFPATGVKITETSASGVLRWSNCDPTSSYTIRAGTRARTASGVAFATTEAVFLPVAGLSGGNPPTLTCQSRDVRAEALEPGPDANVAARTVTQVPSNLNAVVIRVTNPEAMAGGEHTETKLITVEDVGAATTTLTDAIEARFAELLAEPGRAPEGPTIVPQTRTSSEPQPVEDPVELVGQEVDSFTLTYRATGTVTAVRESAVHDLADSLIRGQVAADRMLVRDSVIVEVGPGEPKGAAVVYEVRAAAEQVGSIDAEAVRQAITGRSVDDARERLRDFGDADLDVWPGWVTAIPTLDFRLEIRVVADLPTEPATSPTPDPAPTATPRRTPSPVPTRASAPAGSPVATPRPSGS